jgi:hypothetical protein
MIYVQTAPAKSFNKKNGKFTPNPFFGSGLIDARQPGEALNTFGKLSGFLHQLGQDVVLGPPGGERLVV